MAQDFFSLPVFRNVTFGNHAVAFQLVVTELDWSLELRLDWFLGATVDRNSNTHSALATHFSSSALDSHILQIRLVAFQLTAKVVVVIEDALEHRFKRID